MSTSGRLRGIASGEEKAIGVMSVLVVVNVGGAKNDSRPETKPADLETTTSSRAPKPGPEIDNGQLIVVFL